MRYDQERQEKVGAFEIWAYRRVLRASWRERRANKWILEKIGTELMLRESIAVRKMRLFGHTMRQDGLERHIWTGTVDGVRGRGRAATKWFKDIKEWTGMGIAEASQATADRQC